VTLLPTKLLFPPLDFGQLPEVLELTFRFSPTRLEDFNAK